MSEERFSTMDEGTLRKLLEVTLDLAERRQIRIAIRELRRKELEGCEEALASKRFRSEKSNERQENKENRLRSQRLEEEQQKSLDLLSGKLEAIKDVEELTTLLRATSEYEERKLIRAAIRKLRADEIEAVSLAGGLANCSKESDHENLVCKGKESCRELSASVIKEREDLEERQQIRNQIQELHSAQNAGAKEMSSGMVLLLDPSKKQLSSSSSSSSFSSEPATCNRSQSTDCYSLGTGSDLELQHGKHYRKDQDSSSGVEDGGEERESDEAVSTDPASREKEKPEHISAETPFMKEDLRSIGKSVEEEQTPSSGNQSSKFSKCSENQMTPSVDEKGSEITCNIRRTTSFCHATHLAGRHCIHTPSSLLPSLPGSHTPRKPNVAYSTNDQVTLPPFQRASSVRDRVKKFTEESPSTNVKFGTGFSNQKAENGGRGARILQQQQQLLLSSSPAAKSLAAPTSQRSAQTSENFIQKRQESNASAAKGGLARGVLGNSIQRGAKVGQGSFLHQTDGASKDDVRSFQAGSSTPDSHHSLSTGEPKYSSQEQIAKITKVHHEGADKQEDGFSGRSHVSQLESNPLTSQRRHIENSERSCKAPEEPSTQPSGSLRCDPSECRESINAGSGEDSATRTSEKNPRENPNQEDMKTVFTIEIKDGRNQPSSSSRIIGTPSSQRAELTLGLRASPFKITTGSSNVSKMDTELVEQPQLADPVLPNGMEKAQEKELEKKSKLSAEELSAIEEEDVLDKMLDQTTDFEERRLIRTAMRELRQKKRDQREKERDQRLQEMKVKTQEGRAGRTTEATMRQSQKTTDGSSVSTVTKTERLVHSNDGNKTSRTTTVESSYVKRSENGGTVVQTKSSFSSTSKKVGSIFDREDDASSRGGSLAALERRQAERKKEMMKAQSLPKTSATQARKAMIDKLEKESGSPSNPALSRVAVQRSSSFGVPNANSIKQMLLDWCKTKTRGYEHVDIQNFSSSWSDGMAFCALVHNFFPDAFDYSQLHPQNRRKNFDLAFSSAEKHADCPQLLDVDDMVRMREPDWKCVYTYIQEFYRCLVQKGLVKTKKS
ncbi:smoothelin isoform X2 [Rhinatrema bivittatum]|uniref:smoothelin isoform X2 n=1 Tax=Rhinatrema bivittatum TaxID=194408 RepID=UPI00112D22B1|nr:smoothelin isoform X2 [Rhinatrema bivittatum]